MDFATAQVEIYGLTLPVMGQLTTLAFKPLDRLWNAIEIAAGERGSDLPVIFRGCVTVAYADLNGSSPVLKIEAQVGAYPLLEPASTVSIKGTQDAATFIQSQSAQAGFDFQNDGVKGTLSDTTIYGDPITKIRTATNAIGADVIFDDDKTVLIPKDGVRRAEGGIPLVSAATGMIGYPVFTSQGIQCKTFFRPELRVAAVVKVESIVPHASGTWKITQLTHTLSAHNPGSSTWETSFDGMWQGTDDRRTQPQRRLRIWISAERPRLLIRSIVKGMINTAIPVRVDAIERPGDGSGAGYLSATPLVKNAERVGRGPGARLHPEAEVVPAPAWDGGSHLRPEAGRCRTGGLRSAGRLDAHGRGLAATAGELPMLRHERWLLPRGLLGADADDFRAHRGLGRYHDHGAGDGRREHEREDDQRDVVLRHKHSAGDDQHSQTHITGNVQIDGNLSVKGHISGLSGLSMSGAAAQA